MDLLARNEFLGFLEFVNSLNSLVFWVRSADYKKQLFVSEGFQKVWQAPTSTLYEHPGYFEDTLVQDHSTLEGFLQRSKNNYTGTVIFPIKNAKGQLVWIRDTSCSLLGSDNKIKAVAGAGEVVNLALIEKKGYIENTALINNPFYKNFINALEQELRLKNKPHNPAPSAGPSKKGAFIQVDKQPVWFTNREMDILEQLLAGHSAKQTAARLNISRRTVECHLESIKAKTMSHSKLSLLNKFKDTTLV